MSPEKRACYKKKHLPTIIFQGIFLSFQGSNTVDGRNPAPVDMVNLTLITWFYTSQVAVWYFFHQQYVVIYQPKGTFWVMRNHRNLRLTSFTNTLMVFLNLGKFDEKWLIKSLKFNIDARKWLFSFNQNHHLPNHHFWVSMLVFWGCE